MTGDAWDDAQAEIARLRAEVAALQETGRSNRRQIGENRRRAESAERELAEARKDVEALAFGRNAALKREAEARGLLAEWFDNFKATFGYPIWCATDVDPEDGPRMDRTAAFLRRDEARRCDCYQSGDMTHARDCPARDEAPGGD